METQNSQLQRDASVLHLQHNRSRFMRCLWDDSGQTLVLSALCMVVLIGFAGLSVDVGKLVLTRRQIQVASDAAAQAAALEVPHCNSLMNCAGLKAAAKSALAENGFASSSVLTNCAPGTGKVLELTINNPPCELGTADSYASHVGNVEVLVSAPVATTFAKVLGISTVMINARSEAMWSGPANCVYALDPSGAYAVTVDSLAQVTMDCGIVDESNSFLGAFLCSVGANVTSTNIATVGPFVNLLCSATPTPTAGAAVPVPADPLATLPSPTVPACGVSTASPYHGASTQVTISGSAVLYADAAYCGGILILPTANVTFEPGTYVLKSTNSSGIPVGLGGITVPTGASVTGTGVTFYNAGPLGQIAVNWSFSSAGGVQLVAPTSGIYSGILFFQDRAVGWSSSITGSAAWNTVLEGAYYFPDAKVYFSYSGISHYNILVAKDIEFQTFLQQGTTVGSGFSSNYSSLATGSPLSGSSGAMVVE